MKSTHPIPSTAPKAPIGAKRDAKAPSVPAPQPAPVLAVEVKPERAPVTFEATRFANAAVRNAVAEALRYGWDAPPRFEPPPAPGIGRNVLVCSSLAKRLQSLPGVRKDSNGNVKAGNAALLLALAVAEEAFGEPVAVATVKRVAVAIFAPEKSTLYRNGPVAWFDGYYGTARARGLLESYPATV